MLQIRAGPCSRARLHLGSGVSEVDGVIPPGVSGGRLNELVAAQVGNSETPAVRQSGRLDSPALRSEASDVGGEEVDGMAVEVAAGAVVVLGGAGVGVAGEDLGVA